MRVKVKPPLRTQLYKPQKSSAKKMAELDKTLYLQELNLQLSTIDRVAAKFFFDAKELVVFSNTI